MNIYLIRHGRTEMNQGAKKFCGSTNVHLAQEGIETTSRIPHSPVMDKIEKVYITNLIRTEETASLIFGKEREKIVVPAFAEMDFGEYEGAVLDPSLPVFDSWINDIDNCTFPGGDNAAEKADSLKKAFIETVENAGDVDIAIVSHCTAIRLLLARLFDDELSEFRKYPIDNSSITKITYENGEFTLVYAGEKEFR